MNESERQQAASRGLGQIRSVTHTATILHAGWEMDNHGWIVEMEGGRCEALTTDHGGVCRWTRAEAEEKLAETEASVAALRRALELWPAE